MEEKDKDKKASRKDSVVYMQQYGRAYRPGNSRAKGNGIYSVPLGGGRYVEMNVRQRRVFIALESITLNVMIRAESLGIMRVSLSLVSNDIAFRNILHSGVHLHYGIDNLLAMHASSINANISILEKNMAFSAFANAVRNLKLAILRALFPNKK